MGNRLLIFEITKYHGEECVFGKRSDINTTDRKNFYWRVASALCILVD
jgi:hypothetical protein